MSLCQNFQIRQYRPWSKHIWSTIHWWLLIPCEQALRAESPSSSQFIWEDWRRLCSQGKLLHDYCSSQTVSRIYKYSNLAATVAIKINHIISLNNLHIRSNADISHTQSLETHRRCTTEKNLLLPEPLSKTNSGIRAYVNAAVTWVVTQCSSLERSVAWGLCRYLCTAEDWTKNARHYKQTRSAHTKGISLSIIHGLKYILEATTCSPQFYDFYDF